ncbi:tetratricopeptide repeat protein [Fastidiosibacter lacustris]|uniref:tetratricopeptide repeat protein n=1 Tax=Fastidiosibacter lacustris TaxID=2056695 RepID=UPI000E353DF8|nr:tetratricopeptide repeat protein [Fastidiosibacter lacustris]
MAKYYINKSRILITTGVLLAGLGFQLAHACVSKAYNDAYALFKHGEYAKSVPAFTKLYNNGCPTSPFFLGTYYTYGIAVKQNYDTAIKYFDKFLDEKNLVQPRDYRASVYRSLALIYKEKNQPQKAFDYLVESAKLGNTESMFLLGRSYLSEDQPYHTKTNLKEAFYWLNKVAVLGNIEAMKLIYQHSLQNYA